MRQYSVRFRLSMTTAVNRKSQNSKQVCQVYPPIAWKNGISFIFRSWVSYGWAHVMGP